MGRCEGDEQLAQRTEESLSNSSPVLRESGLPQGRHECSCWVGASTLTKDESIFLDPGGSCQQENLRGRREVRRWQCWAGEGADILEPFFNACFPCLNPSVPVSVTVFITQPPCANKPHMFWFFCYLLSQDKVEMSVPQELHYKTHTDTHWQTEGTGPCLDLYSYLR